MSTTKPDPATTPAPVSLNQTSFPLATLEAILAINDMETKDVPIPVWGLTCRLRRLSQDEAEEIARDAQQDDGTGQTTLNQQLFNKLAVCKALVVPLLDMAGADRLWRKSSAAVGLLVAETMKMNGWTNDKGQPRAVEGDADAAFPVAD